MTLPIDLVLVRHGESEGNAERRRAEAGDPTAYSKEFMNRHTATYHLTELGRRQARLAGEWLRKEFRANANRSPFGAHYTSSFARALETAALLKLPNASWYINEYLTERSWGDLDHLTPAERQKYFAEALARKDDEPFFWEPGGVESFLWLGIRVDRVLDTLHRKRSEQRVCLVGHGETIRRLTVSIERTSQQEFKRQYLSNDPFDRIYNCEIIHYTRRNPENGYLAPYANWKRRIRATESPVWDSGWQPIVRERYGNADLLKIAKEM